MDPSDLNFNGNEGETMGAPPLQALWAAEMMHLYVHVLEEMNAVEPEDTVFLQINLQEQLLLHSAVTSLQVMNDCLDNVANGFLKKMAEATGIQKEGEWIKRLQAAKAAWRERQEEQE